MNDVTWIIVVVVNLGIMAELKRCFDCLNTVK